MGTFLLLNTFTQIFCTSIKFKILLTQFDLFWMNNVREKKASALWNGTKHEHHKQSKIFANVVCWIHGMLCFVCYFVVQFISDVAFVRLKPFWCVSHVSTCVAFDGIKLGKTTNTNDRHVWNRIYGWFWGYVMTFQCKTRCCLLWFFCF